jgi:hypothetical protein
VFKSLVNTERIIIIKRVTSDQEQGSGGEKQSLTAVRAEHRLLHIHQGGGDS